MGWWRPTQARGSQGRSCVSGTTATPTASSSMTRGRRMCGARWTRTLSCARGSEEGDVATFWRVTLYVGLLHFVVERGVICKQFRESVQQQQHIAEGTQVLPSLVQWRSFDRQRAIACVAE